MDKNSNGYISFPNTQSPTSRITETTEKTVGFFCQFGSSLVSQSHNYIDLLKILSDGIADLLFDGSNRLETFTEVIIDKRLELIES